MTCLSAWWFVYCIDVLDHVFVTEMTHGCPIDNFVTNSMVVHAESDTPTGTYTLAPIRSKLHATNSNEDDVGTMLLNTKANPVSWLTGSAGFPYVHVCPEPPVSAKIIRNCGRVFLIDI